jgi:hypothetical protein
MPRIAPTILRANVHDQRFRMLSLGLQGRDERILSVHQNVVDLSLVLEPDREFHRHYSHIDAANTRRSACLMPLTPVSAILHQAPCG